MRDPYEVLGIQRGATDDEIKKAYRAKCKRWHPDLNPNDPTAEEHFKEVQAAYDAITKGETGPQMGGPSGYGQQSYGGYQQGYSGYQQGYGSNGWQQGDFDFGFDPFGFGFGFGDGLSIVAARSYGAQDEDLLKRTVAGSLVIGLCASFVITTAGFFGLRPLLQLLDTPAEILEDAYRYIIVIDLGVLVMFLYNLCAGLLRAIGNSVMPLVFLLISSGLNVALDLWFIAGLGMGVQGAAVATVIAQGISVVLCILYVMRRVPLLLPARRHWAVGQHLYWELFSQSISMGLMSSIVSAGSVVLQYGINGLGTLTIAGHTAARKLFSFTSMPLISMANAGSTFVSQNRGAAQPERVRKGMRTMYLCSVVIMAADIVLMQLFARQLVQLISGSTAPLVLENGARYLMWNAPFYAVLGVLLCTRYALQSLGQKVLPLFSSVIELVGKVVFVLVFIPRYAYNAVILCEPIIWCFMAAYLVAVYRRDAFVYPRKGQ